MMPDLQEPTPTASPAPELDTEIASSLATVWARYAGARPAASEMEFDGSVVRWVIAGGTAAFAEGMAAESEEGASPRPERTVSGYKRDTAAAVAKVTHRRVVAVISKHDKKTGVARETFILESPRKRY
jgi:hypothetical protein